LISNPTPAWGSHRGGSYIKSLFIAERFRLQYRMLMDGLAYPTSLWSIDSQSSRLEGQNFLHFHQSATFASKGFTTYRVSRSQNAESERVGCSARKSRRGLSTKPERESQKLPDIFYYIHSTWYIVYKQQTIVVCSKTMSATNPIFITLNLPSF